MRAALTLLSVLAAAVAAWADPPKVDKQLVAPVGVPTELTVTVPAGKKLGTAATYPKGDVMFARMWTANPDVYLYWVWPKKAGTWHVPFWTEGETEAAVVEVVTSGTLPPVVPPPVDPPVDPPPTGTAKYYFVIVRPDGSFRDEIAAVTKLPAWDELQAAGHLMTPYQRKEMPAGLKLGQPGGVPEPEFLPAVLRLKVVAGKSVLDGGWKKVPTTDQGVRDLLK
jgi:hypothetical protein